MTAGLAELLIACEPALCIDEEKAKQVKASMKRHRRDILRIYEHVPVDLKRALLFAKEKMASSVFTTRPLKKYGFCFPNKRDFRDLIAMRYHREPDGVPSVCSCGKAYSLNHSQESSPNNSFGPSCLIWMNLRFVMTWRLNLTFFL